MEKSFEKAFDLSKRIGKILICGEEGAGKTLLSTYISIQKMLRGQVDCWKSFELVDIYNSLGYHFSKNYEHLLFSNFDINCSGTYIPDRKSYVVDPFRLGLYCSDYETDLVPPLAFIVITECQRVFNAYMWNCIRPEVRAFWETSRQAEIELLMDTNQPELVYKGMRELCNRIIYLYQKTEEIKDRDGVVVGHKLFVKEFKKYNQFVKYLDTSNEKLIDEEYELVISKCVYQNYDSYQCRMLHLKGRAEQDYIIRNFPEVKSVEDVEKFVENFGLTAPEGYYVKPSQLKKSNVLMDNVDNEGEEW